MSDCGDQADTGEEVCAGQATLIDSGAAWSQDAPGVPPSCHIHLAEAADGGAEFEQLL
jgi:hypothetical protein